ncbi:MAG: 1-deoxy-D-xylulose-5-phosphate reductoisomerase [Lachnospiraceae bacterium]|nr:1-deoxy-D-xylulose-5-phosphate reductoisomerase [Lachnospiraceae bacterium]
MKNITVLGSTGSIGTQTLDVVRAYPQDFKIVALAAGRSVDMLEKQIREFKPSYAVLWDEADACALRDRVRDIDVTVLSGMEGLITVSTLDEISVVVTAIVGMIGIRPTVAAIKAHKDIALANKETLVCAGHIIIPLAKEMGVNILPVDSEHSAIFQCLNGEKRSQISKILLTASGGPFRGRKREELVNIKPEDALKHPNWAMGAKITIDSSTMVNKGLEVMEAKWLFGVEYKDVQVVVQPQSIIHSMVEFDDGAVMAQLGTPDMKLPIQYALFYPDRLPIAGGKRLDFTTLSQITFEVPDMETFAGLKLAYQVGNAGGNMPTVFNAANEVAVAAFLNRRIGYLDIFDMIEDACEKIEYIPDPDVEQILETQRKVMEVLKADF